MSKRRSPRSVRIETQIAGIFFVAGAVALLGAFADRAFADKEQAKRIAEDLGATASAAFSVGSR